MRQGYVAVTVAVVGAIAGCAPHIRPPVPSIALPVAYTPPAAAQTDAARLDRWWIAFGDAQLDALIDTALARSTDARLAFATLREARAIRRGAFASTLPAGNVGASFTRQYTTRLSSNAPQIDLGTGAATSDLADLFTPTGAIDSFSIDAAPRWEVDLFGRLSSTRIEARASFAAAYLDYEAARLSLAADVAIDLFEARGYAAQLADARETLRIATALADAARLGVERGVTAGSDSDRLTTDVANADAEIARLQALLDSSRRALLVLVGRPAEAVSSIAIVPELAAPPEVQGSAPAALLQRRPDVRAAEMRLIAASAQVGIDRAALFPRLTLQPGVTLSGTNSPIGANNLIWQIGAGLALPILNRPALLAQLRISASRGDQAAIRYEAAVQTAFREAERALTNVAADRIRQVALGRATNSARRAFEAKQIGFRLGLNDLTTLLQAETAWRAARAALTTQQVSSLQNTVTAFKVLGGGWAPPADAGAAGLSLTDPRDLP
ncbi:MAG TPA: efflux transporter outer membrane subunit [Sphingobium sp.]|uniref:efflux transporter outer membrane subunit n=1 Tax=Sphingobium sp. TaxID=1912891 RepID=UPI002ED4CA40